MISYTDYKAKEKQQEENAACRKCGFVRPITQLTDGMCDICLHYDGKKIKCHACNKDIFFSNYERFILNKKIPYYCEECAKLEKNYPCKECGKMIHISPEKHMNFMHRGIDFPVLCRDCNEKVLDNYLCRQCGKRIYRNVNQVLDIMKFDKKPFIYCWDCSNQLVGEVYYCRDCKKLFQFTRQEEYDIQQRMKERPDWVRSTRCPECREKKHRAKGLS